MSSIPSAVASAPPSSVEATAAPASDRRAYRMSSLDILRGLVIVVMALDHVRDFVMTAAVQDPTAIQQPAHCYLPPAGSRTFAPRHSYSLPGRVRG